MPQHATSAETAAKLLQWRCLQGLAGADQVGALKLYSHGSERSAAHLWKLGAAKSLQEANKAQLGLKVVLRLHLKTQDAVVKAIAAAEHTATKKKAAMDGLERNRRMSQQELLGDNAMRQLEGDLDMYTPENLHKRRKLRTHPDIVELLEIWWAKATMSFDHDGGGALDKKEYRQFHRRLVAAFATDDDVTNDLSAEGEEVAFEEDWANDSRGQAEIDKSAFFDSVFELADTWCHSIDLEEYAEFLRNMFSQIWPEVEVEEVRRKLGFLSKSDRFGKTAVDERGFYTPADGFGSGSGGFQNAGFGSSVNRHCDGVNAGEGSGELFSGDSQFTGHHTHHKAGFGSTGEWA